MVVVGRNGVVITLPPAGRKAQSEAIEQAKRAGRRQSRLTMSTRLRIVRPRFPPRGGRAPRGCRRLHSACSTIRRAHPYLAHVHVGCRWRRSPGFTRARSMKSSTSSRLTRRRLVWSRGTPRPPARPVRSWRERCGAAPRAASSFGGAQPAVASRQPGHRRIVRLGPSHPRLIAQRHRRNGRCSRADVRARSTAVKRPPAGVDSRRCVPRAPRGRVRSVANATQASGVTGSRAGSRRGPSAGAPQWA